MHIFRIFFCISVVLTATMQVKASEYKITCNANGYVIKPKNELPLYAGKDCDAYHKHLGGGNWCWKKGEVLVNFSRGPSSIEGLNLPNCANISSNRPPCSCATNPLD